MPASAGAAAGAQSASGAVAGLDGGLNQGGAPAAQGGSDAGEGGAAPAAQGGSGADAGITVTGTVVDSWRLPVSGCRVALGTSTTVTGTQGEFRFEHVTPPYDIAFNVPGASGTSGAELWLYTGLTRTAPTLQFDHVLANHRTSLYVERTHVPTPADGTRLRLGMSFAAPGLQLGAADISPYGGFAIDEGWSGGSSISGTVHSLAWLDTSGAAVEFLSYQEQPLTIIDVPPTAASSRVTLDFSASAVTLETYPVSVEGEQLVYATLGGAVVFDDNAAIWVDELPRPEATNPVPLPALPGGHAVMSAWRSWPQSGLGMVHRRADNPASVTVLTIPTPRTLTAPDEGAAGVTEATRFEWSAGASVSMLDITCGTGTQHVHVVTAASSAGWPVLPLLSDSLPNNSTCSWRVQVHGDFASIDDATSPSGFIDACEYAVNCERGPLLLDGSLASSGRRSFTTAP